VTVVIADPVFNQSCEQIGVKYVQNMSLKVTRRLQRVTTAIVMLMSMCRCARELLAEFEFLFETLLHAKLHIAKLPTRAAASCCRWHAMLDLTVTYLCF